MARINIFNESLRIHNHDENYIDVEASAGYGDLQVQLGFHEMDKQIAQIRCKEGRYKLFQFKDEDWMNDFNFGWWDDAKVVWRSDK